MNSISFSKEDIILSKIQNLFGVEVFTPGLERSAPLYLAYKNTFKSKQVKIITIAGTNGKGQTAHSISYFLVSAKKNIALWTSPHIVSIRERFNYNGNDIDYDDLEKNIEKCLDKIQQFDFKISFYEFLFLVFLEWVNSLSVDFIILEVGLGGKFDAVNHFDCDLALITSISRDHQAILGNSYSQILYEKLGITRANKILLTSFHLNYLIDKTNEFSTKNNILFNNLTPTNNYFESNINLAKASLDILGISISKDLKLPLFKGREEVYKHNKLTIEYIGAHNPDGMRETFIKLKESGKKPSKILISFSKRENRDLIAMLRTILLLSNEESEIYLTLFNHPKAISNQIFEDVLRPICNNTRIKFVEEWKSFLNGIKEQSFEENILVVGSYYFIGEIQRFFYTVE